MSLMKLIDRALGRKPKAVVISAVVIRADGTVEDLGPIAEGDLEFKGATK